MVKIQEKFSLFHKMDIWAVRSNRLWLSSVMWKPYILAFILFYKDELKNSKKCAAIPHLNKELFYNLPIGIPPLAEQQRIACQINNLFQLIK
ncbi:restriction endonuclease subunit S [Bacteroides uniformis]|uniref:restriction endonuclease subunit S n=1 Tax=Bacteroides uniformis TaxID=820 RepID=UPI002165FC61|nr:restriction endonuclease subunit S [Bacteroides uniformis]MCS3352996.1 restriction endonuclease subunit S [Bacteroides uniformis]